MVNLILAQFIGAHLPSMPALSGAALVGFLGYGVSLVLFVLALRHLGAARTGAYFSTAPFIGAVLAIAMFGEEITARLIGAGFLMGIGLYLHLSEAHEHEHEHEALEHERRHIHDACTPPASTRAWRSRWRAAYSSAPPSSDAAQAPALSRSASSARARPDDVICSGTIRDQGCAIYLMLRNATRPVCVCSPI